VVGAISQISYLTQVAPFLSFINNCPKVILGVITNLLPVILLSVLMALLPVILRFMGKFAGRATLSLIELHCHESYFWFQVIQVFLVTTMTSAASAAVPTIIKNPGSLTTLLAQNLPLAANFYISYFILQGLTFSSGALLQIVGLVLFYVLGKVLDTTPRKLYNRWSSLSSLGWGTVFPVIEYVNNIPPVWSPLTLSRLLTVISITYSAIAPLILGFATIGLLLFYFAFRYNLLFVNSSGVDTRGMVYPKALQHTLVGCYLAALSLIGLFGIRAAPGPLVLMVIFLIFMILYHISLNSAFRPLLLYLPRSLEAEEDALLRAESGVTSASDGRVEAHMAEKNGVENVKLSKEPTPVTAPSKTFLFKKFLRPDIYCDYAAMRRLVPHDFAEIRYSPEVERDAYQHPAVTNVTPLLWVPHDEMGVSGQECAHTNKVTPITDEGAHFDEKGRLLWADDTTGGRHPPIWEEKIYY